MNHCPIFGDIQTRMNAVSGLLWHRILCMIIMNQHKYNNTDTSDNMMYPHRRKYTLMNDRQLFDITKPIIFYIIKKQKNDDKCSIYMYHFGRYVCRHKNIYDNKKPNNHLVIGYFIIFVSIGNTTTKFRKPDHRHYRCISNAKRYSTDSRNDCVIYKKF